MRFGLIGLPQSGRFTVFSVLGGVGGEKPEPPAARTEARIATAALQDERLGFIAGAYQAKKQTPAKLEYLLPADVGGLPAAKAESALWSQVRVCDALLPVIRNYPDAAGIPPSPEADFHRLEEDMILADLAVAEKRLERIELDRRKGRKPEGDEQELVNTCHEKLSRGEPLRNFAELAGHPVLKGFTFLTAKPMLVIVNNHDEDESLPRWEPLPAEVSFIAVRGRLEAELAAMSPEEAGEFLEAYHVGTPARQRIVRESFAVLGRIFFYTANADEAHAWPVAKGTSALDAAGEVHSDIQQGFIRAETLPFADLKSSGSFQEARKAGLVRLEGKEYVVQDGDIIYFRFNI